MRFRNHGYALMSGAALSAFLAGAASAATMSAAALAAAPAAPKAEQVSFNVYLPLRNVASLQSLLVKMQTPGSGSYHKWLTPAAFNTRFGPTAASAARVQAALKAHGLTVTSLHGTVMQVSGTAGAVNTAFATTLKHIQVVNGPVTEVAQFPLKLPAVLKSEGAVLTHFAGTPRMHPNVQHVSPSNRTSASGGYFYNDLKQAYGYPSYQAYNGTGASIAVVIDANPLDSDVAAMFSAQNFATTTGKAAPTITHQLVDGGTTSTADIDEADLDVQQMIGGAPGAKVTVLVVPDLSDDSIMDGYNAAVNPVDANGNPLPVTIQAVNSSFGECELFYTAPYNGGTDYTSTLTAYDAIFMQGNAEGITFVASSGDSAGLGCVPSSYFVAAYGGTTPIAPSRFIPGIESPASSAYVTAVGGTNLITSYASGNLNSTYVSENANGDPETNMNPYGRPYANYNVSGGFWGAGGGVSQIEAAPANQALVLTGSTTYRTSPDLGMQVGGCPSGESVTPCGPNRSYVITYISGAADGLIGTSVASPEFVGALALYIGKNGGGVGNINPYLYAKAAAQNAGGAVVFNRYIPGFNGEFTTAYPGPNYNYSVGNGTPQVANLFGLGTALAGTPQSASNP
jgi:subtilase family serine protease